MKQLKRTMKGARPLAAIVVLAAIITAGSSVVPAAGAPDQTPEVRQQRDANGLVPGGPTELNAIRADLQRLVDEVNNVKTALPEQTQLLTTISSLASSIHATGLQVLDQVSGLGLVCTTPDLIPRSPADGKLCQQDDLGNLKVTVQNQGAGQAGPSTASVFFRIDAAGQTQEVVAATRTLAGFGDAEVQTFPIPEPCFGIGDNTCKFTISVDSGDNLFESNETNNIVAGQCSTNVIFASSTLKCGDDKLVLSTGSDKGTCRVTGVSAQTGLPTRMECKDNDGNSAQANCLTGGCGTTENKGSCRPG